MTILTAENITKKYDDRLIIKDVSLHLDSNEVVCLLGISGIGKSTLFHVLSGLVVPEKGKVLLSGADITGKPGRISYMQQKDLLLPYKSILDNIALPLIIKGEKKENARKKASDFFDKFGLSGTQNKYPSQLSGGMRQRAALLRTYLFSGEAALLDEPFSALDAITKTAMHNWYNDVMSEISLPTIFITHDIDEAILLSDRIYIMSGTPGRITSEIKIEVKKPRHTDFTTSDEFIRYKREILRLLDFN
ncbi:MAG: ABC transporter ATP-binding protein [Bacillota bacterium]|nr:ABC transporter ATP-binding protein [Bacillota bacterium]